MLIEMRTVPQRDKDRFSGIKPVLSIQPAHIGLKKGHKNITPARPLRVQALDRDLQECSEQQLPIVGTGVASPGPQGVIPTPFSFCVYTEHGELVLTKQDAVEADTFGATDSTNSNENGNFSASRVGLFYSCSSGQDSKC